jgi:hypothetical protein
LSLLHVARAIGACAVAIAAVLAASLAQFGERAGLGDGRDGKQRDYT